jgi:hypothetical protein
MADSGLSTVSEAATPESTQSHPEDLQAIWQLASLGPGDPANHRARRASSPIRGAGVGAERHRLSHRRPGEHGPMSRTRFDDFVVEWQLSGTWKS